MAALLISAGVWTAMGYGIPTYRAPGPEIERIVLDIARSQVHDPSYFLAGNQNARKAAFATWCYNVAQRVLWRHILLAASAFGGQAIPGTVSYAGDGIVSDAKWSLVFQRDRERPNSGQGGFVVRPNQAPYQRGMFTPGSLPDLPPMPAEFPPPKSGPGCGVIDAAGAPSRFRHRR